MTKLMHKMTGKCFRVIVIWFLGGLMECANIQAQELLKHKWVGVHQFVLEPDGPRPLNTIFWYPTRQAAPVVSLITGLLLDLAQL
ncbi:MAG: hypothetical protein CENE_02249 [Candidatus Celerinatantimonas neptuna]|nr:MAG: hypothetical protein CENE_02249 [Candidatus Celerinatantimonas neptuna]